MEDTLLEENILGKRIRWLREKKDYKQNIVARKLGITPYQLSRYESGKSKPDPELIAKFADFYEVTTDYLLGKSDNPNPVDKNENDKIFFMDKIAKEFPDIDLMFKDLESLTAEDMKEVYEYIKFKMSQKRKD